MVLSDTLSNLDMLNYGEYRKHWEYSKYQLSSLKVDMAYADILWFKDIPIQNGSRGIKMLLDTLSDQDNLNYGCAYVSIGFCKESINDEVILMFMTKMCLFIPFFYVAENLRNIIIYIFVRKI